MSICKVQKSTFDADQLSIQPLFGLGNIVLMPSAKKFFKPLPETALAAVLFLHSTITTGTLQQRILALQCLAEGKSVINEVSLTDFLRAVLYTVDSVSPYKYTSTYLIVEACKGKPI